MSGLTALEAIQRIKSGQLSSVALCEACFTHLDDAKTIADFARSPDRQAILARAEAMDDVRRKGNATGVLHGLPIVVEETFGETGTSNESGQSAVVHHLKEAGAVVLGQATEGAAGRIVARGSVPLGVALDTNNGVITQASDFGCVGFVPSRGTISRRGCESRSASLDQIGVFGLSINDCACLADALAGYDSQDSACHLAPKPPMLNGANSEAPATPILAWFEGNHSHSMPDEAQAGFEELLQLLGDKVERLPMPASFTTVISSGQTLYDLETSDERAEHALTTNRDWLAATSMTEGANEYFQSFFIDYDAILACCESTEAGQAQSLWSIAGLPRLSLPWMESPSGAPIGVQLIGFHHHDDRLLRTASWLNKALETDESNA